jgi:hypothetical protein
MWVDEEKQKREVNEARDDWSLAQASFIRLGKILINKRELFRCCGSALPRLFYFCFQIDQSSPDELLEVGGH